MSSTQKNIRTFYTIVATQTMSIIGSQLSGLAIGYYVFAQTGQATPLLLVSLFGMLPSIFAANVGGMLADRWDRRKLMLFSDAGQAVCTLLLLFSFASGSFQLWHLYTLTFISRLLSTIQGPAFTASITMLVPEDKRDRANALTQLSDPAAGIIAPVISGIIYAALGVVGTIFIDLATFLLSAAVFVFVTIPQPAQTEIGRRASASVWTSLTSGLRFLWARKPLFVLLLQASLVNFCIAGSMGMGMAYLLSRTGSEATAGLLLGLSSAGMLAGGIIFSVWGGTRPRIHTILPSLIFSGVCLMLFGFSQSPVILGLAMVGMMFPLSWVNAPMMSILQAKTPPDMQGRVFAVLMQVALFLTPIAYLLYGYLADNVLEPAVGTPSWDALAPFVGNNHGSGMAVIYVTAGIVMAVSSALIYLLPMIRNMEANLPDYVATPIEDADAMEAPAAAAISG
jgi:MFS transporter, DHA3 family, macrolide efflux protein